MGQCLSLLSVLARSTGLKTAFDIYLCADGCELQGVPYERISWGSIHTGAAFHLQGIMLSVTTCLHDTLVNKGKRRGHIPPSMCTNKYTSIPIFRLLKMANIIAIQFNTVKCAFKGKAQHLAQKALQSYREPERMAHLSVVTCVKTRVDNLMLLTSKFLGTVFTVVRHFT